MRKNFLYILIASVLLISCNGKNALNLNNTIVKANEDLKVASQVFNKQFEAVKDNNYAVLELERQNMVNLIDKKIKEVSEAKSNMPGGDDFKNSFTDYYKFEKDIYENEFKDICKLTGAEGDGEKLTGIAIRMQVKAPKENSMEAAIHSQQTNFAKKNNLKLQ